MAQESLEETQRRLGLSTGPVTNARAARQFEAQPVPTQKPINVRGAVRTFTAVAAVVVLGIVGYAIVQALPEAGLATDEWTTYPGTYFTDSDDILANASLETQQAEADELLATLQASLGEYGFEWSTFLEGTTYPASNGYGGDSMLYSFTSDNLVGSVQIDDPDARADIIAIFSEVMASPTATVVISNNELLDEAEYYFGSTDRQAQALWSAWSYEQSFSQLQADIAVFDATVPTGQEFDSDYWVPENSTGTLFVRFQVSAHELLSDDDRQAFIEALKPYEGKTKPEYRS